MHNGQSLFYCIKPKERPMVALRVKENVYYNISQKALDVKTTSYRRRGVDMTLF